MFSFPSIPDRVRSLKGWRRYGTAYLSGALAALAFPPFDAVPLFFVCFPLLAFLLQGAPDKKRAFALGWTFAFGLLTICLYWIAGALFVDIKEFWWLVPFAVCGLPAMFAVYHGLATLIAWRWGINRLSGLLILAVAWTLADYARGHLMTGFPWDLTGYIWGDVLPMLQITSVAGIYGLTLLTLTLAVLPAALARPVRNRASLIAVLGGVIVLCGIAGWGQGRLDQASNDAVPNVRLRLVQANISQAHKWLIQDRETNFKKLLDFSFVPADSSVTAVIWPETATAFYLTEDTPHRQAIAANLTEGQTLLTGAVQRGINTDGTLKYLNSLIGIDRLSRVIAGYAKFHLVPFGEYVPFRQFLPFKAVAAVGDFTPGEGLMTLRVPGLPPFSPLVCYEGIFSNEVARKDDPPAWMLNVTNDAWYEGTTGPYQHFAIVRVRAIEEGMPLVRVSNLGVNAVVDPYGRLTASQNLGTEGSVTSDLPNALPNNTIFYAQGNRLFWLCVCLLLTCAIFLKLSSEKPQKSST